MRPLARARPISLVASALLVSVLAGGVSAVDEHADLELTAEFTDAGAIVEGNDVAVDGVRAGSIRRVELIDGKARVTFSVEGAFAPIHEDASAAIRMVSLLGERYLDLNRGTPSARPLADGAVIPADHTERTVEIQEILDVIDQPTGTALAALIVAMGEGMAARGEDSAAALDALAPAFTETARLLDILGAHNQLLTTLIDRSEPVLAALGAERGERLDRLVAASDTLMAATAAERPALEEALRRLPTALSTARSALTELSNLAGQSAPVLASLRPLTGDLRQMAHELGAFADAAGPALASSDAVLEKAKELVAAATPVAAELRAAGPDMETAARGTRHIIEALPEDLSNLLDFVRNSSLAVGGPTGLSHYLRIFVLATSEAIGVTESPLPGPPAPPPAAGPPAPAPFGPPPVEVPSGSGLLSGVTAPVDRLLTGRDPGSATGLTETQERSLLRYLLGARGGGGVPRGGD